MSKSTNQNGFSQAEWTPKVQPPTSFTQPLNIKEKLLMIPGPTNTSRRVLEAMTTPVVSLFDPQFFRLLKELQTGIRYLFQTKNEYTFALTSSGTSCMEVALVNLLLPGQKLLTLAGGFWGERVAQMGERLSLNVVRLKPNSLSEVYSFEAIEDALRTHSPKLMYVCQGDSSLGTLQPIKGLGDLCHKYDCTLLVDGVVTLCTTPLAMDELGIDVLFSAAQKALSGPCGVAMISFNDRAVQQYEARSAVQQVSSFYMDIGLIAQAWCKKFVLKLKT